MVRSPSASERSEGLECPALREKTTNFPLVHLKVNTPNPPLEAAFQKTSFVILAWILSQILLISFTRFESECSMMVFPSTIA